MKLNDIVKCYNSQKEFLCYGVVLQIKPVTVSILTQYPKISKEDVTKFGCWVMRNDEVELVYSR